MAKILLQTAVGLGVITAKFFTNTIFLNQYRKLRARYDFNGNEMPLRKDIQKRFQEVINDLKIPELLRNRIKIFNVYDIVMFHAGTTCLKYGAIIGIPANFEYNDPSMLTEEAVSFQYTQRDLNTEESHREFRESLVLSENAQKFAMGHTILTVIKCDQLWRLGFLMLDALIGVGIYSIIINKAIIKKKVIQPKVKALYATVIIIFSYISDRSIQGELDCYREEKANTELAELGPQYIEGGIEYYEKKLKMNKALRTVLGSKGPYLFSSNGNATSWFGKKHLPINEQIEFFNTRLQNFESA